MFYATTRLELFVTAAARHTDEDEEEVPLATRASGVLKTRRLPLLGPNSASSADTSTRRLRAEEGAVLEKV